MDSFARLREMVHEMTGVPEEQITPESTADQLHLDSLDMTELVLSVEEELGKAPVRIPFFQALDHVRHVVDIPLLQLGEIIPVALVPVIALLAGLALEVFQHPFALLFPNDGT